MNERMTVVDVHIVKERKRMPKLKIEAVTWSNVKRE
jgi:hypothetical protein